MRVGVDLVRVSKLLLLQDNVPSFDKKVFSSDELSLAGQFTSHRRVEFLAGRYAMKEAVMKGLGVGLSLGARLCDVETLRLETGAPVVRLNGVVAELASALGIKTINGSISHDGDLVIAFVTMM